MNNRWVAVRYSVPVTDLLLMLNLSSNFTCSTCKKKRGGGTKLMGFFCRTWNPNFKSFVSLCNNFESGRQHNTAHKAIQAKLLRTHWWSHKLWEDWLVKICCFNTKVRNEGTRLGSSEYLLHIHSYYGYLLVNLLPWFLSQKKNKTVRTTNY